jgi:N-acetylneuraminic acid mutarotase
MESMKNLFVSLSFLLVFSGALFAQSAVDPLPEPVSNNAVAMLKVHGQLLLYSFMGIGAKKTPDAITNTAFSLDAKEGTWSAIHAVPGTAGRIGAMAASVRDELLVFGGYAGAVVDGTIIYVDGARKNPSGNDPRYVASDECWMGKIDHHDPSKIQWTKLPNHPGAARYRIAGGGSDKDQKVYFAGGTDNPYSYNGIGYDGKPSEPSAVSFDFNLRTGKWETLNENTPDPTMDHRGLLVTHEGLVLIGGMEKGQKVTAQVVLLSKEPKAK